MTRPTPPKTGSGLTTSRARPYNPQDEFRHAARGGNDPAAIRARVEAMEHLLDRAFAIPGTNRRIGLDSIIGLVPVVGDAVTGLMSAYLIWEARNLGMSKWQLARMAANIGIDTAVGAVPVAGDLFDFAFKSNTRNLKIIKRHLDRHHPRAATIDTHTA